MPRANQDLVHFDTNESIRLLCMDLKGSNMVKGNKPSVASNKQLAQAAKAEGTSSNSLQTGYLQPKRHPMRARPHA